MSTNSQTDPAVNPNKALWEKGDFTRIAESMRESGEALVAELGDHAGARRSSTSAAATAPPRCPRPGSAPRCSASTSRATSSRPATARAQSRGPDEPAGSRKATPATCSDLADDSFDLVVSHLRRDVRAEAVRRREGDGARHPAGRPHRDGQLDPGRPDARRADPEDQLGLLAAAAGGLRQPDDLGRRGNVVERFARAGVPAREHLVRARHLHVRLAGHAVGVPRGSATTTDRR